MSYSYEQLYMQFKSIISDPNAFKKVCDEAQKLPIEKQDAKVLSYLGPIIKGEIDKGNLDFLEDYYGVLSKKITSLDSFCNVINRSLIFLLNVDGLEEDFLFTMLDECDTLYKLFEKYVGDGKKFKELKYPVLYEDSSLLFLAYIYFDKNDIEYSIDISEYMESSEDEKSSKNKSKYYDDYDEDTLKTYLRQIGRIPLLTKEEEYELGLAALYGDEKEQKNARDKLVEHNLKYVVIRAKRRQNGKIDLLDLIQTGNQGLMKAATKYDVERGFRFTTYATWWIDQAIGRYIQDNSHTIRKPVHYYEKYNKITKAIAELTATGLEEPTPKDISEYTGYLEDEVKQILIDFVTPISLSAPVGEESDSEFGDFIEDTISTSPEDYAVNEILKTEVDEMLKILPQRDQEVLKLRYGLVDGTPYTLEAVGAMYNLTRERIRQIESRALRKLRLMVYKQKQAEKRKEEQEKASNTAPVYKPYKRPNKDKKSDE